ncbi:hypothetical protein SOV_23300 [Sporomusa ovata DSM 2662]|uniref:Uncharacterized protein n=1 Tax=Sporomusa ovata TaxID=2378 RepID=A0A0U1L4Z7_9FIRM|nr:hypothetical protein [Sporomusa ovata]EQB25646.1 hypothetical protein SOV_4c03090 [Sporomusa ovata DSM 2662]CQR74203.1 hypothetical protein SpAn4DRAFT_0665 [Sporomusa ovata]
MSDNMLELYQSLGFEETEVEDGQPVLGIELTPEGAYALLTDAEGLMPKTPNQEIIFAYYTPEDSYLWSASFKNSTVFKNLWTAAATIEDKLTAITNHREANQRF